MQDVEETSRACEMFKFKKKDCRRTFPLVIIKIKKIIKKQLTYVFLLCKKNNYVQ